MRPCMTCPLGRIDSMGISAWRRQSGQRAEIHASNAAICRTSADDRYAALVQIGGSRLVARVLKQFNDEPAVVVGADLSGHVRDFTVLCSASSNDAKNRPDPALPECCQITHPGLSSRRQHFAPLNFHGISQSICIAPAATARTIHASATQPPVARARASA